MRLTPSAGIVTKSRRDFDAMPMKQDIHSKYDPRTDTAAVCLTWGIY
jgi:hypothetical protein